MKAGGEFEALTVEFATMAADLLPLRDWLRELGVTHVAMEATGMYWKPVYYALEDDFELLLVNAQHVKNVTESAKAVVRTKGTYLSARYHRMKSRRGHAKATIATAHKILTAVSSASFRLPGDGDIFELGTRRARASGKFPDGRWVRVRMAGGPSGGMIRSIIERVNARSFDARPEMDRHRRGTPRATAR